MSGISLHVLDCGRLTLPRDQIWFGGGSELVTVPIPAFLIRHPDGDLVFEGGMQPDVRELVGDLPGYEIHAEPEHHVAAQVEALGVSRGDVRYAITSHLHWDHVGAIGHFPAARHLVHRADWEYARDPDWFARFAYPAGHIGRSTAWDPFDVDETGQRDLLGDGSVVAIHSPGHSPGLISLLVRLDSSPVLLTSDAAVSSEHFADQALPFYLDAPATVRSVRRLREVVAEHDVRAVIFGHDLAQFESLAAPTHAYR